MQADLQAGRLPQVGQCSPLVVRCTRIAHWQCKCINTRKAWVSTQDPFNHLSKQIFCKPLCAVRRHLPIYRIHATPCCNLFPPASCCSYLQLQPFHVMTLPFSPTLTLALAAAYARDWEAKAVRESGAAGLPKLPHPPADPDVPVLNVG